MGAGAVLPHCRHRSTASPPISRVLGHDNGGCNAEENVEWVIEEGRVHAARVNVTWVTPLGEEAAST